MKINDFTQDQLLYSLKEGMLVLFFDGYDEIDHDMRARRAKEILDLANTHDKTTILISGRPDDTFFGWDRFVTFKLLDLTEAQVRLLIKKIPYDQEIKDLFNKKMDEGLYVSRREFLVNPLLAIMMLITLEQFADIPPKIHLFYEYAFDALFARHDTAKGGGFQRKRHVNLALDDYRRLFSYFCAISYLKETFTFSETAFLELLEHSITASQIIINKRDMLNDLIQCTCMVARDGLDYVFTHRSFQEYFMAYFVARVKGEEFEKVAPKLVERGRSDNVLIMVSEMNKEKFEEAWVLPQLARLWNLAQNAEPASDPFSFIVSIGDSSTVSLCFYVLRQHNKVTKCVLIWMIPEESTFLQGREVIYSIYDLNRKIREEVKHQELDDQMFKKIATGEFMPNDKRF
jgi:hypothetical protein